MTVTRWWWIRHAPVPNRARRIYGRSDVSADIGDAAAFAAIAAGLPEGALWITSQLTRAKQTAAALGAALAARGVTIPEPLIMPDFCEQNFGDWQGKTYAEIAESADGGNHKFWIAPAAATPPGGENFVAVMARVAAAIEAVQKAHGGRDIIAVAHGGSIRAALALALDLAPEGAIAVVTDNLSLTRIDHVDGPGAGGVWRVAGVNLPPGAVLP